jgi:type II secretion system protein N
MKRLGVILLAILFVLVAFWIGLMLNFPGEAASRYVERQVNGRQAFDLVLTPARLRWNRLYVARAELRRRDNPTAEPLFTLTDFAVPLSWRLFGGLPVSAVVGKEGTVEAYLPWGLGGEAAIEGHLQLETLPLPAVVQPIALSGRVDVQGHFTMDAEARLGQRLPDGTLEAVAQGLVVSGVKVAGQDLPATRLDAFNLTLETGRTVNVRRLEFRGDLQGTVEGTVTPNLRDPRNSLLALKITSAFRDTWVSQLGTLQPLLQSFLNRGRVVLNLSGTVGRPNLQPVLGAN